jgi:hypothetical protein
VYFVTIKRAGYCMFCVTQSERCAIALTDDQQSVHLLERTPDGYVVRRETPVGQHSHTDIMLRLGPEPEPATFDAFARLALEN